LNTEDDFVLHLPFWNSFPWEVNSFPELKISKSRELFIASKSKSLFSCHVWGVPWRLSCMAKMRYFRATGMIFSWLPLLQMEFEGIWGHYFAIGN
jgi:hypothetical protein